jgi:hypothetical protein
MSASPPAHAGSRIFVDVSSLASRAAGPRGLVLQLTLDRGHLRGREQFASHAAGPLDSTDTGLHFCSASPNGRSPVSGRHCGAGAESGGHGARRGRFTLPYVPVLLDLAAPVPVLAAGGIVDRRGVARPWR